MRGPVTRRADGPGATARGARLGHTLAATVLAIVACAGPRTGGAGPALRTAAAAESIEVLALTPAVTATIVRPARLDPRRPVELILYALPNGNSTSETMGRPPRDSTEWRYDIQHIAAQTRAYRAQGHPNAVVGYLEAEGRSWPAWRARLGAARANARIVGLVDELRAALGAEVAWDGPARRQERAAPGAPSVARTCA